MNPDEAVIRVGAKLKFWYERYEKLNDSIEELQSEARVFAEKIEKISNECTGIIVEITEMQNKTSVMEFSDIE